MANPEPPRQEAHGKAGQPARQGLYPEQAAARHVLEETRREPDQTARLGSPAEGDERGQDERQVGRDAADAPRRHHAGLREAAPEGHEEEREAHGSAARYEEAGDVLRRLAGEEQDFFDPREVHRGRHHGEVKEGRALVLDGRHASDRYALGKERAYSGGDDQIAGGDAGSVARHELEAQPAARLALHETGRPRTLDHRPHRGGGIVEKLNDGRTRPDLGHTTDETFGDDDRHLLGDAVGAPAIDGERPGPAATFAADDLSGEGGEGKPVAKREETPQPAVLLIRLPNLQSEERRV